MQPVLTARTLWTWLRCGLFWVSVAVLGWWAVDRAPPFKMLSYVATPARAGENMRIERQVMRDTRRKCSVEFNRYIVDSRSTRADVVSNQFMDKADRDFLDHASPGVLNDLVPIPVGMAPGRIHVRTVLNYRCNPLQELMYPIVFITDIEAEVLP